MRISGTADPIDISRRPGGELNDMGPPLLFRARIGRPLQTPSNRFATRSLAGDPAGAPSATPAGRRTVGGRWGPPAATMAAAMPDEPLSEQIRSLCESHAPVQLARGRPRHRRHAVRLHVPEPGPLPVAVVLGLVLHGDRMAALRSRALAAELESLLAAAARGRLHRAHDLLEHAAARRRRFTYNVISPGAPMTASIQPPLLAWAWRIAVGDPALEPADRAPPRLARRATATSTATV